MITYFLVLLLVLFIAGSAFLSASETALFSLPSLYVKTHPKSVETKLLSEPRKLLVTILMLNIAMNILVQNVVATLFDAPSWLLNVGLPLVLTLLFGDVLPKGVAYANNKTLAPIVAPVIQKVEKGLGPVRGFITFITSWLSRWIFFFLKKEEAISIEELKLALSSSKKQKVLGFEEVKLVRVYLNLE